MPAEGSVLHVRRGGTGEGGGRGGVDNKSVEVRAYETRMQ